MKKYKITYFSCGNLKTKTIETYANWYNIVNEIFNYGINEFEILKLELEPEAQN